MLTLIWCLFHPDVIAVGHERPQSFCQQGRWQVTPKYAYTLDPVTQRGMATPLSSHSVGTYLVTSSHLTCQGTFGHSHLCLLRPWHKEWNQCEQANLHVQKKKVQAVNE